MNSIINKINHWGYLSEQKISRFFISILVAVILIGIAMIYVAPDFEAAYHGALYAQLSEHPFNFILSNPIHYRILGPLIGYITFLRGDLFFLVPLIFGVLLLSAIYIHFRKINFSFIESMNMAAIIAFSCTILIPIRAPGYIDTITYYFIFLSFSRIRKPLQSTFFFGIAMFSHECSIFILPGLIAYQNYLNKINVFRITKNILFNIASCIPYLVYRYWVSLHTSVDYDFQFYFSSKNLKTNFLSILPLFIPGLFFTFKLFWIYPIWIMGKKIKSKNYGLVIVLLSIIIVVIAQLFIAFDVTRMLCLLFPAILISAKELKTKMEGNKFVIISSIIILINFVVPQYFASNESLVRLFHLSLK